ncbi:unnamed protein product [Lymnaea stagnalis]|uniref:P21-activated protein kinase-interacting protein 1-like n=1 Tax=Lymnaea stagnalis TaxID=6523 RepID=A0AAV2I2L6_LYMST
MENIELVIGTYENLMLGYKVIKTKNELYSLDVSFTDDSHRGALRSIGVSPIGILASSSTDDSIRLHNLNKRRDIGGLFEHTGTVNCLTFYGTSHMFSASEDGNICMWKSKNWEMLRTLKGHKSHVMSIAVHPSGKLGLSVGSDKSFLTWDLVTGKMAFQRRLKELAQIVLFTNSGDHYILVYQRKIEVCSLEDTSTVKEIPLAWRINSVCFIEGNLIAVGGDDRNVIIFDVLSGKQVLSLDCAKPGDKTFNSRVRSVCVVNNEEDKLVVAGTAIGNIMMFKVSLKESQEVVELVLFYETRVRVTCLAAYNHSAVIQSNEKKEKNLALKAKKKRKSKKVEEAAGDDNKKEEADSRVIEEDSNSEEDDAVMEQPQKSPKKNPSKKRKLNGDIEKSEPVERGRSRQKKVSIQPQKEDNKKKKPKQK